MKKLLGTMAAVAALAFACSPVLAEDTVSKLLTIGGDVDNSVSIPNDPTAIEGSNNNSEFENGSITITSLASTNMTPAPASITVKYDDVSTNYPTKLTLTSNSTGLTNSSVETVPSGFTNKIYYTAVASKENGEDIVSLNTSSTNSINSSDLAAFSNNITVTITIPNGDDETNNLKLLQGHYSDTLTLQISPL
jgi:hypothetical protein